MRRGNYACLLCIQQEPLLSIDAIGTQVDMAQKLGIRPVTF